MNAWLWYHCLDVRYTYILRVFIYLAELYLFVYVQTLICEMMTDATVHVGWTPQYMFVYVQTLICEMMTDATVHVGWTPQYMFVYVQTLICETLTDVHVHAY